MLDKKVALVTGASRDRKRDRPDSGSPGKFCCCEL